MSSLLTTEFERYIAESTVNNGSVILDEFIFAYIPELTDDNLANYLTIPNESQIVHRQAVSQTGLVNQNAVVYSVTIGTEVGDWDFNYIGLINRSKNLLACAIYTDTISKIKNKEQKQGNSITRNILLEFSNAQQLTNINVAAETWQIDFTLRLSGIDEKIRLTNRDLYGRAAFFGDAFLVKRKSGNNYSIEVGQAYIEGVRADLSQQATVTASRLPCSIYLDITHHATVTGAYQTELKYITTALNRNDYLGIDGFRHYVQILADIDSSGNITDRRLVLPQGLVHYIPNSKKSSAVNSTSTDTVATSAAVKTAYDKAVTAQNTANAAIPNSNKSSSVTSSSTDTVATSKAVKDAYDKSVEAWNKAVDGVNRANNAQNTANLAILKNNDKTTNNVDNLLGSNRVWGVDNGDRNALGFLPDMYNYGVGLAINRGNGKELIYFPHASANSMPKMWIKSSYTGHSPSRWGQVAVFDQDYGLSTSGRFYTTSSAGRNSYVSQNTNEAPFYVQTQDSSGQSLYLPFLKGKVSNGTATQFFSFGIETPSRNNQVGDGIIHLISNAGVSRIWRFLDNGDFNASEVVAKGNKRLSTAVQISDFTQNISGNGWCKLPNGLILQWVSANRRVHEGDKLAFPIAFRQIFVATASWNVNGDSNFDTDLFYNSTHVWGRYQRALRVFAIGI